MESFEPWEYIPFGRTFAPIYALLTMRDIYAPPYLPSMLTEKNDRPHG